VCAALSAGYGRSSKQIKWGATDAADLRRYLGYRLEMLLACLEYNGSTVRPRSFFEHVETSEKAALSFITGCLGTHLAARRWTAGGGTRVVSFLHTGIYTNADVVLPSALIALAKARQDGKVPDFLVKDGNQAWHAFESKGGTQSSRWKQVVAGLKQLENVGGIGYAHPTGSLAPPVTAVCVQTVLDSGHDINIVLVDPPGDERSTTTLPSENEPPPLKLRLVPGVAELFATLEVLDWFHGLTDSEDALASDEQDATAVNVAWTFGSSRAFGGIRMGVPSEFLTLEAEIRRRMGLYRTVIAALERVWRGGDPQDQLQSGVQMPHRADFIPALRLAAAELGFEEELQSFGTPRDVYDGIQNAMQSSNFQVVGALHGCAIYLSLAGLAEKVEAVLIAEADLVLGAALHEEAVVTEGGLYLAEASSRGASRLPEF
jgi:hypothetical protein